MISTLVVDDDPVVAMTLTRFVGHVPGYTVVATAGTAAEARKAITAHHPHLLLLDLHLPDANGLDFAARVRRERQRLDVIVITGRRDLQTVRTAMQDGVLHYLLKPVRLPALSELLRRYQRLDSRFSAAHTPTQDEVNQLFRVLHDDAPQLPKGMSQHTVDAVQLALAELRDCSAHDVAAHVGISRPTAARYLEHLADIDRARRDLAYGARGRPQHRYRCCD
ncbi:MAG: response regulator [Sciscionella sp.]